MKGLFSFFLCVSILFLANCQPKKDNLEHDSGLPTVQATNYPLYYFAKRIAGDLIDLHFEVAPGVDPAYWHPSDEVLSRMQAADLLLMNGATYEKWAKSISLPSSTSVDTSHSFSDQLIVVKDSNPHSHGDGIIHRHDGYAHVTWLDMDQAIAQIESIHSALSKLLPDAGEALRANKQELLTDIHQIDRDLVDIGKELAGTPLFASHPVYQYLSRRYGFNIHSLTWNADTSPSEAELLEMDVVREEHSANYMIWDSQPIQDTINTLKASGITSVVFDPCANQPIEGDWLEVMKRNISNLKVIEH